MTQEEKNLLLEDICCRLPYNVKCKIGNNTYIVKGIDNKVNDEGDWSYHVCSYGISPIEIEFCKPYLFPLSAMTETQREKFLEISHLENRSFNNGKEIEIVSNEVWTFDLGGDVDTEHRSVDIKRIKETIKWLNKNHFDWRGLIPMGLAEDATNKNIY